MIGVVVPNIRRAEFAYGCPKAHYGLAEHCIKMAREEQRSHSLLSRSQNICSVVWIYGLAWPHMRTRVLGAHYDSVCLRMRYSWAGCSSCVIPFQPVHEQSYTKITWVNNSLSFTGNDLSSRSSLPPVRDPKGKYQTCMLKWMCEQFSSLAAPWPCSPISR